MSDLHIYIVLITVIVSCVSWCWFFYLRGKKKGYKQGDRDAYHRGYNLGRAFAQARVYTSIIATGNNLKLYINGKEANPSIASKTETSGARSAGLWYLDGHQRDGFLSPDIMDEEQVLRIYAKDYNRILNKMDIEKPPVED